MSNCYEQVSKEIQLCFCSVDIHDTYASNSTANQAPEDSPLYQSIVDCFKTTDELTDLLSSLQGMYGMSDAVIQLALKVRVAELLWDLERQRGEFESDLGPPERLSHELRTRDLIMQSDIAKSGHGLQRLDIASTDLLASSNLLSQDNSGDEDFTRALVKAETQTTEIKKSDSYAYLGPEALEAVSPQQQASRPYDELQDSRNTDKEVRKPTWFSTIGERRDEYLSRAASWVAEFLLVIHGSEDFEASEHIKPGHTLVTWTCVSL